MDQFRSRLHQLREMLCASQDSVLELVARCPTVLLQLPATTQAKLHGWAHLLGLPVKAAAALLIKYPPLLMSNQVCV